MRLLLLCVFLMSLLECAFAEEQRTFEQRMLDTGDDISRSVDRMADQIDMLLAGKRYTRMPNKSSARISQLVTHREGGKDKLSTDFNLNLRLPNLEKRWAVRFTSYDEAEESRDLQQRRVLTRPRRREYGAAVGFFRKLGKVRTTFQPRLVLKDPLEMSYILRFESNAEVKPIRLIPRLELFADPTKGTGEFVGIELVYKLADRWEMSNQNEEEYRERGNLFTTNHGLSFDYALSDNQGLGLSFVWTSSSRPAFHLDSFTIAPSYAQEIYRDRLKYSLTPFIQFAKVVHFQGDVGVTLNIVIIF